MVYKEKKQLNGWLRATPIYGTPQVFKEDLIDEFQALSFCCFLFEQLYGGTRIYESYTSSWSVDKNHQDIRRIDQAALPNGAAGAAEVDATGEWVKLKSKHYLPVKVMVFREGQNIWGFP